MLKRKSIAHILSVIVALTFVLLSNSIIVNAISIEESESLYNVMKVKDETEFFDMNGTPLGTLSKDVILSYNNIEEEKVYFDLLEGQAFIFLNKVDLLESVEHHNFIENKTSIGKIKIDHTTEIYGETDLIAGTLNESTEIPFFKLENDVYSTIIGDNVLTFNLSSKEPSGDEISNQEDLEPGILPEIEDSTGNDSESNQVDENIIPESGLVESEKETDSKINDTNSEIKDVSDIEVTPDQVLDSDSTNTLEELENTTNLKSDNLQVASLMSTQQLIYKDYFKVTKRTAVYHKINGSLVRVGAVDKGQEYPIVSDTGGWLTISFGDSIGYVNKVYTVPSNGATIKNKSINLSPTTYFTPKLNIAVYDTSSGKSVQFGSIYEGVRYPLIYDIGDWYQVNLGGRVGYIREKDVVAEFNSNFKQFEATQRSAIYEKTTNGLVKVGAVDAGQEYLRIGDTGGWHQILFGNMVGYVNKEYTKISFGYSIKNLNTENNSSQTFYPTQNIAVYDTSSGKSVRFGTLNEGIEYPLISDIGAWYRIDLGGRVGFVSEDYVVNSFKNIPYFKTNDTKPIYAINDPSSKIGEIRTGQAFQIIDNSDKYYHKVMVGGKTGLVSKIRTEPHSGSGLFNLNTGLTNKLSTITPNVNVAVYDTSTGKSIPFATLIKGGTYNIVSDIGSWYGVEIGGRIGYVNSSNVDSSQTTVVTSFALPVYRSFSELANYTEHLTFYNPGYTRYLELSYGDEVKTLEEYLYGVKIETADKKIGWVHKDYLSSSLIDNWWLVKSSRSFRNGPGTDYSTIGSINANSKVRVLEHSINTKETYKNWYKITTEDGRTGWIWGDLYSNNDTGHNLIRYEFNEGQVVNQVSPFTSLLSKTSFTADQLNSFLNSKTRNNSLMRNMAEAYLEAQSLTGLNAIYLIAHSGLETGWGNSLINKEKYNYYGIGAIDSNPVDGAYTYDSPKGGIIAGAYWIKQNYSTAALAQPTIDSMRNNNNTHQYAADEAWAVKIAHFAKEIFNFLR